MVVAEPKSNPYGFEVALRLKFLIVGGFYSEVALRNERQRAQCILNTS